MYVYVYIYIYTHNTNNSCTRHNTNILCNHKSGQAGSGCMKRATGQARRQMKGFRYEHHRTVLTKPLVTNRPTTGHRSATFW